MTKSTIMFILVIGTISCKTADRSSDKLETVKQYFTALQSSSGSEMEALLSDSLSIIIPEYGYEVRYSKDDYVKNWLRWDAVFQPAYEVLDLCTKGQTVEAKISKADERILFFMNKPFLTTESITFKNGKIAGVTTEYVNFNDTLWGKNRTALLNWSSQKHPELNLEHYINVQTESGGRKLLQGIQLYQNMK